MFIHPPIGGGYDRTGQQRSGRGQYLALFSFNEYKQLDEEISACADCRSALAEYNRLMSLCYADTTDDRPWDAFKLAQRKCAVHLPMWRSSTPAPKYDNGHDKLYAIVRFVSLTQCGHWMMGSFAIGGKRITVSGPIGRDGLPLDLQDIPPQYRDRLVEVPSDVALIYWSDDGHNTIGKAAPTLRKWAQQTFG